MALVSFTLCSTYEDRGVIVGKHPVIFVWWFLTMTLISSKVEQSINETNVMMNSAYRHSFKEDNKLKL